MDRGSITIDTRSSSESSSERSRESSTEVTRGNFYVYGMAGTDGNLSSISYGVGVSKSILGPISLGVYGTTKADIGVTVGLNF